MSHFLNNIININFLMVYVCDYKSKRFLIITSLFHPLAYCMNSLFEYLSSTVYKLERCIADDNKYFGIIRNLKYSLEIASVRNFSFYPFAIFKTRSITNIKFATLPKYWKGSLGFCWNSNDILRVLYISISTSVHLRRRTTWPWDEFSPIL